MSVALDIDALKFDNERGTVVVVAQDAVTGRVLMVAHADREALEQTIRTGEMHYRSRTRGLWHKGATSGNVQRVISVIPDCDADTVLARVAPAGPACHSGMESCFGDDYSPTALSDLDATISARDSAMDEEQSGTGTPSYTRELLGDRNLRLKKIGEEGAELIAACADGDASRAAEEAADLLYHVAVALKPLKVSLHDVARVLSLRGRGAGL